MPTQGWKRRVHAALATSLLATALVTTEPAAAEDARLDPGGVDLTAEIESALDDAKIDDGASGDAAWTGDRYQPTTSADNCLEASAVAADFLRFADKHARGAQSTLEMVYGQTGYTPDDPRSTTTEPLDASVATRTSALPEDLRRRAGLVVEPAAYVEEARVTAAKAASQLAQTETAAARATSGEGDDAATQWELLAEAQAGTAAAAEAWARATDLAIDILGSTEKCFDGLDALEDAVADASDGEVRVLHVYDRFEELARRKVPNWIVGGGTIVTNAWCETGDVEGRMGTRTYPAPLNSGDGAAYLPSHQFTPSNGATVTNSGATLSGTAAVTPSGFENQLNVAAHVTESYFPERKALHWQNVHVFVYAGNQRMGPETGGAYFHDWYRPLCYANQYDDTEHFLGPVGGSDVWFGYLDVLELRDKIDAEGPVIGQTLANTAIPDFPGSGNEPFFTVRTSTVRRNTDAVTGQPNESVETSDDFNTVFVSDEAPVPSGEVVTDGVGARLDDNAYNDVNVAGESFVKNVLAPSNINTIMNTDLDGPGPDAASQYFEKSSYSGVDITLDSAPVVNASTGETAIRLRGSINKIRFDVEKTNGDHAGYVEIGPVEVSVQGTVDIDGAGQPSASFSSPGIDIGTVKIRTDCGFIACWGKSAAVRNFVNDELGTKIAALLGQSTTAGTNCFGFNNVGFSGGAIIGAIVGVAVGIGLSVLTGGAALAAVPMIVGGISGALTGGSVGFSNCSNIASNGTVIDTTFWDNMAGFWGTLIGDFDVTINDQDTNPISLVNALASIEDQIANLDIGAMLEPLEMADTDDDGTPDTQVRSVDGRLEQSCLKPPCTNGLRIESQGVEIVGSVGIRPEPAPAGWQTYHHATPPGQSIRDLVDNTTTATGGQFDLMGAIDLTTINQAVASFLAPGLNTADTTIVDILPPVDLPAPFPDFPGVSASLDLEVNSTVPPVLMAEEYHTPFTNQTVTMSNGQPFPYTLYVPGLELTLTLGEAIPGINIDAGDVLVKANVGFRAGVGVNVGYDGVIGFEFGFPQCPGADCPIHLDYLWSEHLPDFIAPIDLGTLADEAIAGNLIKGEFFTEIDTQVEEVLPSDPINLSQAMPNSLNVSLFGGVVSAAVDLPDYVWVETDIGAHGIAAWFRFSNVSEQPTLSVTSLNSGVIEVPGGGVWGFSDSITATPLSYPGSGNHLYDWTVRDGGPTGPITHQSTVSAGASNTLTLDHTMLTWTTSGSGWDTEYHGSVYVEVTVSRGGFSDTVSRYGWYTVVRCGGSIPC